MTRFPDRRAAGRQLGAALQRFADRNVLVLGLVRGGVPVAFEVAKSLHAPFDVLVVRKVGVPYQPELAMAAVGEDGVIVINEDVVRAVGLGIPAEQIVDGEIREDVERRARRYRRNHPRMAIEGHNVIVVDDGIATGATARAGCQIARANGASHVVLAVPVGRRGIEAAFGDVADEVVCLQTPEDFLAVGEWYRNFGQVPDEEVDWLLAAGRKSLEAIASADPPSDELEVELSAEKIKGFVASLNRPRGVVVFVHGSGSSRFSPRNRYVAEQLNEAGFATLLFDLLTAEEEINRQNVFDIDQLSSRLHSVVTWLREQPGFAKLGLGLFGASTGAAAALRVAAEDHSVAAVVARGGRPDLAGSALESVICPSLLIVGGNDSVVMELNKAAVKKLNSDSRLVVIPGATHLFEETGALEAVAKLARDWFSRFLVSSKSTL